MFDIKPLSIGLCDTRERRNCALDFVI